MADLATRWTASDSLGGTVVVSDGTDVPVCRIPAYRENKKEVGAMIAANPDLIRALKGLLTVSLPSDVSGSRMIENALAVLVRVERGGA